MIKCLTKKPERPPLRYSNYPADNICNAIHGDVICFYEKIYAIVIKIDGTNFTAVRCDKFRRTTGDISWGDVPFFEGRIQNTVKIIL